MAELHFRDSDSLTVPLSERVYTADEVRDLIAWFGGRDERWIAHVQHDAREVINVGRADATAERDRYLAALEWLTPYVEGLTRDMPGPHYPLENARRALEGKS